MGWVRECDAVPPAPLIAQKAGEAGLRAGGLGRVGVALWECQSLLHEAHYWHA
jgi:hypothetical protein